MTVQQSGFLNPAKAFGRVFKINDRVTLGIPSGTYAGIYPSRVEDFSPQSLTLSGPTFREARISLPVGSETMVAKVEEKGVFEFNGRVAEVHQDPLYQIVVEIAPGEQVRLNNRRAFVRLECRLPIEFQITQEGDLRVGTKQKTLTKNLSGNGVCLVLQQPLLAGTQLEMYLALPDSQVPIYIMGEVVRIRALEEDSKMPNHEVGIRFTQIRLPDQDRIVGYIFAQERQTARKS